jgi:hypothetical protein
MISRKMFPILVTVTLAAGCGDSPSSPSPVSTQSSQAAEAAVMSAMTQAMSQVAMFGRTSGGTSNPVTMPCAGGGSMLMTLGPTTSLPGNVFQSSSRIEFRDCRNQNVTLNGDPYLETSAEHSLSALGGTNGDSTSTIRTTGGVRMDNGGVQGRMQFNCTMTVTIRVVNGTPSFSVTSAGTTTFEMPLGSTPVARPCGPA